MADSIRQQILDAVATRLGTITTANGYETEAGGNVYEWAVVPLDQDNLPALGYKDSGEDIVDETVGEQIRTLHVDIVGIEKGTAVTAFTRKISADVIKAAGTDLTWGGLAEDTTLRTAGKDIEIEHKDRKLAANLTGLDIEYSTQRFNSYN